MSSTTEDRARAAMQAIAGTVDDAPPLRLTPAKDLAPAPDEVRLGGHGSPDGPRPQGAAGRGRA